MPSLGVAAQHYGLGGVPLGKVLVSIVERAPTSLECGFQSTDIALLARRRCLPASYEIRAERDVEPRGARETVSRGDVRQGQVRHYQQVLRSLHSRTAHFLHHAAIEHRAKASFEPLAVSLCGAQRTAARVSAQLSVFEWRKAVGRFFEVIRSSCGEIGHLRCAIEAGRSRDAESPSAHLRIEARSGSLSSRRRAALDGACKRLLGFPARRAGPLSRGHTDCTRESKAGRHAPRCRFDR